MRVRLPENIVGRRAVLHFRRCHALAGAAGPLKSRLSLIPFIWHDQPSYIALVAQLDRVPGYEPGG